MGPGRALHVERGLPSVARLGTSFRPSPPAAPVAASRHRGSRAHVISPSLSSSEEHAKLCRFANLLICSLINLPKYQYPIFISVSYSESISIHVVYSSLNRLCGIFPKFRFAEALPQPEPLGVREGSCTQERSTQVHP